MIECTGRKVDDIVPRKEDLEAFVKWSTCDTGVSVVGSVRSVLNTRSVTGIERCDVAFVTNTPEREVVPIVSETGVETESAVTCKELTAMCCKGVIWGVGVIPVCSIGVVVLQISHPAQLPHCCVSI